MTDPDFAASPSDERARTLAQFPLSRVTKVFHDEMLGVLPPVHIRGAAGFFVSEAVTADIHAQFVHRDGRFYGSYVALRDPATWITSARIAAYDVDNPNAVELAWYPDGAGEAAA
ncbi:MAG: hypothetical protein FP826_07010 [Sphingomonadales bacterium]|nr:hypothetical protein [Sphingomonadales bacterium]MBU3993429.1 hypothetical protein [Alphaproteobacteria bacterium]